MSTATDEHKVFTRQTLPVCDESFADGMGKVAGASQHASVAGWLEEHKEIEMRA